jgi:hypothetical protein
MAWQVRGNKRYFYRSVRAGDRVVRLYLGTGRDVELMADQMELARLERAAEASIRRDLEDRYAASTRALGQLCQVTDLLVSAALTDKGFHKYRGHWRKRRARPRTG